MKVSLSWLREFVDWQGSVAELTDLLVSTGIEVESVASRGADFPKVVIARILESSQHPNADRLSVCRVDDGSGQPRQIVCGAKNYKVGDKVPLALPGAVLPGDFKIKVGKLRGVESEGMMCSAKELGLAEDAEGLLILPADAPIGQPISSLFPAETIFELEITPNRGDWLSHVGVAREVSAFSRIPFRWQRPAAPATAAGDVRIEAPEACPFYSFRRIRGVKVGPSPAWLSQRLESIGLRSINNIVDITNFVMMEMGQPLHAFDTARVNGGITVRFAREGEKFLALDGREYTLAADQLVIADSSVPLAIAGVMGGEHSGVTGDTIDILLESAIFQTSSVRRTARALDLHSDSSHRFERGVDPDGVLAASARATQLILEIAGGEIEGPAMIAGSLPAAPAPIVLEHTRVRSLLGLDVTDEEIRSALAGLGLSVFAENAGTTTWTVPSHRLDLTRPVDLVEEISRVIGIGRITGRVAAAPAEPGTADTGYDFAMEVRRRLAGFGLSEARTSTLISGSMLWLGQPAVRLKNPLGEDQAFLRASHLPGLLAALQRNIRQGASSVSIFEIGRTFHVDAPEERTSLAIVLYGEKSAPTWRGEGTRHLDWHDARGLVESLLPSAATWQKIDPVAPLALTASFSLDGRPIGTLGQLSPSAARDLDAGVPVLVIEIDLIALRAVQVLPRYREIPRFPSVSRDLAIVAPIDLSFGEIESVIRSGNEELLVHVAPFDIFTDPSGVKLPADRKSVAISLTFRASERTLNGEEVNAACERLRQRLKTNLAVDFRE